METLHKKYAINETWKLCTFAAFLSVFFLAYQISHSTSFIRVPLTPVQTSGNSTGDSISPAGDPILNTETVLEDALFSSSSSELAEPPIYGVGDSMVVSPEAVTRDCRMYEGRWVYNPDVNPMYNVEQCFFLEEKMSCRRNGRPDLEYEGWGWESDGCHIPRFNGTDMLERLRGKRMIIVGDSLNRNQWESLACLLYTAVPPDPSSVSAIRNSYKVLKVKEYEFTLEFYWAPFLVYLGKTRKRGLKVLSLDKLVTSSKKWRGADVMVFNSGHWWTHNFEMRAWDVFKYKGEQILEMKKELAYERALSVWAEWLIKNTDPVKTNVYFRSISPEHKNKQSCFNHIHPMESNHPYEQSYPQSMIDVVERKIKEINNLNGSTIARRVRYLNITALSRIRIDAHPSIFRFRSWKVIVERYKRLIESRSDCSHWCLPGVPDTWNRVLYASLFFDHLSPGDLSSS